MKRTRIKKSDIILKGSANRITKTLYVATGKFKLTEDALIWQSSLTQLGSKELVFEFDQIDDVTVKKPFLLHIKLKDGTVHRFIIPFGSGKGRHKEDWQRILMEKSGATGSVEEADENDPLIGKICMNCGAELPENVKFCSECGTPVGVIAEDEQNAESAAPAGYCKNCGKQNNPAAKFCAGCGSPLD